MKYVMILCVLALGACGANGSPFANLGVKIGPNGVTPTASVGQKIGGVTVQAGL